MESSSFEVFQLSKVWTYRKVFNYGRIASYYRNEEKTLTKNHGALETSGRKGGWDRREGERERDAKLKQAALAQNVV